ncbi:MAG TPA: RNA 2',3'-cyclic phosphodiesterase [Chthoniobacterales bacterium]|nr:RNA 2',3'-cyclic phosphodiesterase [Chthoniobacterales bacterium]
MRGKRLFVSLDLPETAAAALVRLDPGLPGLRWARAEQIHLTLAFLGNVAAEQEARVRANLGAIEFTAFFLPLIALGTFPVQGKPKVVWLGIGRGHPHLFQLHKRVSDAALGAGIEPDLRPWRPHFTLGRCRDVERQSILPFLRQHRDYDGGLIRIEAFNLKSSRPTPEGSIYTTELTVPAR